MEFSFYENKLIHSNKIFLSLLKRIGALVLLMGLYRIGLIYKSDLAETLHASGQFFDVLFLGLRFDLVTIGFVMIPIALFHYTWTESTLVYAQGYLGFMWSIIHIFYQLGFHTFTSTGGFLRHGTFWTARYLVQYGMIWTWTFWIVLMIGIFGQMICFRKIRIKRSPVKQNRGSTSILRSLVRLLLPILVTAAIARGSFGQHHLRQDDAFVYQNPRIIDLIENPVWAFFN
jgi:hypothetical protein